MFHNELERQMVQYRDRLRLSFFLYILFIIFCFIIQSGYLNTTPPNVLKYNKYNYIKRINITY